MTALVVAVFVASVLGSLHCAGMCGGFLAFAVGGGDGGGDAGPTVSRARLQAAYHLGRLSTYTALGVGAGALGAALDLGAAAVGVQRLAGVVAGVTMVVFGVVAILRIVGVPIARAPVPGLLKTAVARGHRLAFGLSAVHRALAVGMLTTLLPCGWLYAFAVTAAGTASPLWGGVTMAVFWLGTLPVMVALGSGVQAMTGVLGRRLPLVTCVGLVAVGLFTLSQRMTAPAVATGEGADASVQRVGALDWQGMPCCEPETKAETP